jgi:AcrR family transcriptional regulator
MQAGMDTTITDSSPSQKRGRGRPRSPELEERMLSASLAVLAQNGFSGLTVEGICARAGVPKATFYRRWSAPIEAALDALKIYNRHVVLEDTGDLAADLHDLVRKLIHLHHDPVMGACRAFFATEARVRPEIAEALRDAGSARRNREREELDARLRRAGYDGRLHADLILNIANGIAYNTTLGWDVSDEEIAALVATLLVTEPAPR